MSETIDESTQTNDDPSEHTHTFPSANLSRSLAILANMFLHSNYWFLLLGLTFSANHLPSLSQTLAWRQNISLDYSRRILSILPLSSTLVVDVARPVSNMKLMSASKTIDITRELDLWLQDGVLWVLQLVKEEKIPDLEEMLHQIKEEISIMVAESEQMTSHRFLEM